MGGCLEWNQMCVLEVGDWDPHPDIKATYTPKPDAPHDMTHPLSHYFISSGHNSYLSGNQLWSRSTTSVITSSLLDSCRVIELDCYNQKSPFSGPIVMHGGTLTAPISFRACVAAVAENAFKSSPYPVVITLENHTDEPNQKQMAKELREVLGSKLYVPQPEDRKGVWKSPEDLKHKVLIRANAGSACEELKSVVYLINTKFKSLDTAIASDAPTTSSFNEYKVDSLTSKAFGHSGIPTDGVLDPIGAETSKPGAAGEVKQKFAGGQPKFNDTAKKMGTSPRDAIDESGEGTYSFTDKNGQHNVLHEHPHNHRPGVGPGKSSSKHREEQEAKEENVEDEVGQQVVQSVGTLQEVYLYTSRHIMRVYPGGLRVGSTNYDPSNAWTLGASFAALNWQNWGTPLFLNRAKFSVNNKAGYVLKPSWMLNPTGKNPLPAVKPRKLCVTIYAAFARQKGILCWKDDMYVALEMRGMPCDCQEAESAAVWNSGRLLLNQKFYFNVSYPEMAQLALILMDDDLPGKDMDDKLGTFCCPVSTLNPGKWKACLFSGKGVLKQSRWLKFGFEWLDDGEPASSGVPGKAAAGPPKYGNGQQQGALNGADVDVHVE